MAGQLECTPELLSYVRDVSLREDTILRELREETGGLPGGHAMQVMAEEGQLLALLTALTGARTVVEVGTYTGYSALCLARALPADGRLITCDITARWAALGLPYWRRAGVADRITLRVGDARETLAQLLAENGPDSADMIFLDADKAGYPEYFELALPLVRPGGLIIVDNTLLNGRVIDPLAQDADTRAVREFNTTLKGDDRVEISLLVMADGITLVRKNA
jgi:O-methyltransferase